MGNDQITNDEKTPVPPLTSDDLFSNFIEAAKLCDIVTCTNHSEMTDRASVELHFKTLEDSHAMHAALVAIGTAMKDGRI